MTRVTFYSNLENKSDHLVSLVKMALSKKHMVTILVDHQPAAEALSDVMWQGNATDFVPNVMVHEPHALHTPAIIDWLDYRNSQETHLFQDDILINLTQQQPSHFSRYRALVELVGTDEAEKAAARQRYKFYRDCGYEVKHQDAQENRVIR